MHSIRSEIVCRNLPFYNSMQNCQNFRMVLQVVQWGCWVHFLPAVKGCLELKLMFWSFNFWKENSRHILNFNTVMPGLVDLVLFFSNLRHKLCHTNIFFVIVYNTKSLSPIREIHDLKNQGHIFGACFVCCPVIIIHAWKETYTFVSKQHTIHIRVFKLYLQVISYVLMLYGFISYG